jgi:hypothetical protein
MANEFYNQLERVASWQVVALLFVLFIICAQGFEWRHKKLGYENPSPDGRGWYSPVEVRDFLHNIKEEGRRTYYTTELTLDLLFPLVYGTLFASFITHVYARKSAKILSLVPLLAVICDLMENIILAYLAWQFDEQPSPVARIAAMATAVKSGLFILSLLLILWGALWTIWRTARSPA